MDNSPLKPLIFTGKKAKKLISSVPKLRFKLPEQFLLYVLLSFLLGRAELLGSLMPLGGAFFAAAFEGRGSYFYAFSALFGMALGGADFPKMGQYIFAMCIFALIYEKIGFSGDKRILTRSGVFSSALLISGIFFMIAASRTEQIVLFYDSLMLFIEAAFAFFASAAFSAALPVVKRMKLSYSLSSREEISLVLLFGGALSGMKDISNVGPLNIADIICILIVLVFSVRLGGARGAVAGLSMGLVSGIGRGMIGADCVSYAFSGLAAGLCGFYGAVPGCGAFILANALITLLTNGSTEVLINIYDIFAACLLYGAIPEKVLLRITGFGTRDETVRAADDEREYAKKTVADLSTLLKDLEDRLVLLDKNRAEKYSEESKLFERTARRACSGCGMRRLCWNRDVQKTCASLRRALDEYKEMGSVSEENLPRNCLRPKEFTEAFCGMGEMYRRDLEWLAKLTEQRDAAAGRLKAVRALIAAAQKKLEAGAAFDRSLADDISRRLNDSGVECQNVSVMLDADSDPIVTLTLTGCGGFSLCENGAASIISSACGREMVRCGKKDCKTCSAKYVPAPASPPLFAFSCVARDKKSVSGDSAGFRVIGKYLYAAVLCDGMGSGKSASRESSLSAETLLDFVEAGLDGKTAMEAVSAFFLPSGEVTFSAADLWLYNAESGRSKIIKCGGAAAFSKSGEKVDAMYSKTMPLASGVSYPGETYAFSVSGGDMVVMITDGVLESAAEGAARDGWIISEMENFRGDDPKRLCDIIVDKALKKCGECPKDDITVLAAYIQKKASS